MPFAHGQHLIRRTSSVEFGGLTHQQLTKRIFEGEREMIAGLGDAKPLLETYFQSLWPGINAQSPIDDAYFLSTVDFTRGFKESGDGRRGYQTFLFGQNRASRKVRLNNGDKVPVYPDGYLDMLFVDLEDFDADTYNLTDLQKATWGNRECLVFSVRPRMPNDPGRFEGQIWVEISNYKIVRIRGTFTAISLGHMGLKRFFGIGSIPLYFHFDSTRQEVSPGRWLPSYSYFDENRTWRQIDKNASTDLHYRGHIFIWGYKDASDGDNTDLNTTANTIARLENERLLAAPGVVEDGLDAIVRRILAANEMTVSDIDCRVLLTTPTEIFNVGHTIILSRGLLNILPNDSVVPVLLAREIAGMLLRKSEMSSQNSASLWQKAIAMSDKAGYSNGVPYTSFLLSQLARHSKSIPNLVRARFSPSLFNIASGLSASSPSVISAKSAPPLVLRGTYTIDSWRGSLNVQKIPVGGVTAKNVPSY